MTHLTEEQMVLHYYNEDSANGHLDICPACRDRYQELARVLDACHELPVPEPADTFETLVWQKLAAELARPRASWWRRGWVLAPVLTALVVAAFFIGRLSMVNRDPVQTAAAPAPDRILLVALGDHLERSQMVLVELANTKPGDAPEIRLAQERARDLVGENRLYRQTASLSGDNEYAGILDDLERVLVDIANSPAGISSPELQNLQRRIESRGLIFKLRVVDSNLQRKGADTL